MAVNTTVGTRFQIAPDVSISPNNATRAAFLAVPEQSWQDVAELTDGGNWGTTGSTASHQPLATGETVNLKAFIDHGSRDVTLGRDITATSQDVLKELSESPDPAVRYKIIPIRIIHQSGLMQFALVQVTGFSTNISGGDSVLNATVGLTSRSRLIDVKPFVVLTYTASTGGSITGDATQTVDLGGDGTQVTAVADASFSFVQWSDGVLTSARTDLAVTDDISVTAEFEPA